jgi:hypothetical protein
MNKKILTLTTLLMVAMVSTTIVGTAPVCGWGKQRTVETFYVDPAVDPPTLTGTVIIADGDFKLVNDGTIKISWGSIKQSSYTGPLGEGTFTMETVLAQQDEPFMPVGEGWAINKMTLEIDDGPFGTGTLKGNAFHKMEMDLTGAPPFFEMWGTGSMYGRLYKNGYFNGVTVFLEGYTCDSGIWVTKTAIIYIR